MKTSEELESQVSLRLYFEDETAERGSDRLEVGGDGQSNKPVGKSSASFPNENSGIAVKETPVVIPVSLNAKKPDGESAAEPNSPTKAELKKMLEALMKDRGIYVLVSCQFFEQVSSLFLQLASLFSYQ